MNLQSFFHELEEFELGAAALYLRLADTFAPDREASLIFYRLHLDEKGHAALVRFQKRLCRQNPKLFREIEVEPTDIAKASSKINAILGKSNLPDVPDAVTSSLEIEWGAAETHYHTAIRQSYEGINHLLHGLTFADNNHVTALRELGLKRQYMSPSDFVISQVDLSAQAPPKPAQQQLSMAARDVMRGHPG